MILFLFLKIFKTLQTDTVCFAKAHLMVDEELDCGRTSWDPGCEVTHEMDQCYFLMNNGLPQIGLQL